MKVLSVSTGCAVSKNADGGSLSPAMKLECSRKSHRSSILKENLRIDDNVHGQNPKILKTYARATVTKNKKAVVSSSCSPVRRILNFGSHELKRRNKKDQFCKTCFIDPKKSKRRFFMPKEYVEEQRAYFKEIDAFKLEEEFVSEAELE